ncbi:hypothetical protein LVJ94_42565 [Pendulispora rubella]|uniref:Uncharacterized protein n=1 Tax=Pendulispora rubella TaxID=2741070 RepID=A0ABZ2KYB4_9BACT
MSTARKILDWHGQADAELTRDLAELPPGRYVLVPEHELEFSAISAEDEAAVEEGLDDIEHGNTTSWNRIRADLEARIQSSRTSRPR